MAVRYNARLGFGGAPWGQLGPGCRVVADAALGGVVVAAQAGLDRNEWWSLVAAALAAVGYAAVPARLEPVFVCAVGAWLAASQVAAPAVWQGLLIAAAAADTSTLFVVGAAAMVAATTAPIEAALMLTVGISAAVLAVIGWALYTRPTRKLARASPTAKPEPDDYERGAAVLPTLVM